MHSLAKPYRIWKTVSIGNGFSEKQLVRELIHADCRIDHAASEFIRRSKFKVSPVKEEVDFVLVAVMQLGLIRASFKTIMERALELGFRPCSVEAALLLRLQYSTEQMSDDQIETISLAMDPVATMSQRRDFRAGVLCLVGGKTSVTGKSELAVRHLYSGKREEDAPYDGLDDDVWAFVWPRE